MKTTLRNFLLAVCLLASPLVSSAVTTYYTRYDGTYSGANRTGLFSTSEATIDNGYVYGSAFIRGTTDYVYFYSRVRDAAGNISGSVSGDLSGTFTGRVGSGVIVVTLRTTRGTATLVLIKTVGYAPTSLSGRYTYTYGSGYYYYFDFYPTEAYFYFYNNGENVQSGYAAYTYRRLSPTSGTVTIAGLGTFRMSFTSDDTVNVTGTGVNSSFYFYGFGYD
jgi:hypothetical protein